MELLVSIKSMETLYKLKKDYADGVIFGSAFSAKFSFSYDELKEIVAYCDANGIKKYFAVDAMISEDNLGSLYRYFELVARMKPDGIYFADLAIMPAARAYGLSDKLIFDPVTLITSSVDAGYYLAQGLGVVLARELTYEEDKKILEKFPGKLDMQIFGHLRMSYSKRKFLSNYFKEIGLDKDISDASDITLTEENRDYQMPIRESKYGTEIYTDYCFLMYKEFVTLGKYLKHGIVDTDFIEDNGMVVEVCKGLKKMSENNYMFFETKLMEDFPEMNFDSGYLYRKTTDKKEDDE